MKGLDGRGNRWSVILPAVTIYAQRSAYGEGIVGLHHGDRPTMLVEIGDDISPLRSSLHVKQIFIFVKLHAFKGQHVDRYAAWIDCLSPHAVASTGNRHLQMGSLRPQEQLPELVFAFLRVARNVPDFSNLCLIQSTNVIRVPCRRLLNNGPIPVGCPNEEEDWWDQD